MIWVRRGHARVLIDDGTEFHLTEGQGLWIPAGYRHNRETLTDPGTVAFPYWPHDSVGAGALTEPTRFEVPGHWQDWLIQYFNLQVTPLAGHGYPKEAITGLLGRPGSHPSSPPLNEDAAESSELIDPPAMPANGGARTVAEELLRDPALDLTVTEWASRISCSSRTLLRDFLADTGLTFEQWRLRNRLNAAIEFLAAGYDVDQVTARTGFGSRNGFTRAFKNHYGSTPHEFRKRVSANAVTGGLSGRAAAARGADNLVRLVRGGDGSAAPPQMLPPARTPSHANDSHVLTWAYRGNGYLDAGDRRYEWGRGTATWIPAEMEHVTGLREDSISLPIGDASTADLQLTEPVQVRFSPAWDDYLMFCSVSARSLLRPDAYDSRHILDLFAEQVAAQRALSVQMPTDPLAREAAMDYLRRIGTSARSGDFDVPAEVHRAFHEQTGMSFSRWRYAARMRIARDLLGGGAKPSAVGRRLGYGYLPNFSAAFTRFHGLSPRDYQERETGNV